MSAPRAALVTGDPSKQIADIEAVDTVFKDGAGYFRRCCWLQCAAVTGSIDGRNLARAACGRLD